MALKAPPAPPQVFDLKLVILGTDGSVQAKSIASHPVKRPFGNRLEGADWTAKLDEMLENAEAALTYQRGEIAASPCTSCVEGKGPFLQCVALDGYLDGACCNCHWENNGASCSKYIPPQELTAQAFFSRPEEPRSTTSTRKRTTRLYQSGDQEDRLMVPTEEDLVPAKRIKV